MIKCLHSWVFNNLRMILGIYEAPFFRVLILWNASAICHGVSSCFYLLPGQY